MDSNSDQLVKTATLEAFSISSDDVKASLTKLTVLRGIGPAAATAILSTLHPDTVPFFSDEAFRWVVHDGDWNKKIGYTMKEYLIFYDQVKEIIHGLEGGTSAKEVERVGWILGQEHALGLKIEQDEEHEDYGGTHEPNDHQESKKTDVKKGSSKIDKKKDEPEAIPDKEDNDYDISKEERTDVRRSKRLKTGPT